MYLLKILMLIWFLIVAKSYCEARKPRRFLTSHFSTNSTNSTANTSYTNHSTDNPINLMNDTNKVQYDVDLLLEKLLEKNTLIVKDYLKENFTDYGITSTTSPLKLNERKIALFFQNLKEKLLKVYHICKSKVTGNKTRRAIQFQTYDEYDGNSGEYDDNFENISGGDDYLSDQIDSVGNYENNENAEWKHITKNVLESDVELLKSLVEYFKSEHNSDVKRYEHGGNLTKICFILNGNYDQINSDVTTKIPSTSTNSPETTYLPERLPNLSQIDFPQTTKSPTTNESSHEEIVANLLKYMAHSHHPVYLSGIPQKDLRVDMKKIQEQIDSVRFKANDFLFQDDEDEKNETDFDSPIASDIDFGLSHNDLKENELKRDTRKVKNHKSKNFLFDNLDYTSHEPKNKEFKDSKVLFGNPMNGDERDQKDHTVRNQEVDIPETMNLIKDEDYMTELNGLNLNSDQHSDIENFLNQINDHPKQFNFDVEPLMQSKLSEIQRGISSQDQKQEDLSPKKYFEFDDLTKKKREAPNYQRQVDHMKNDLISEYKNNYMNLYRNSIDNSDKYKNQLDTIKRQKNSQKNDFLDKFYLLNDGKIDLEHYLRNTPTDTNGRLINSMDLDLDLKLNKEFEDLEFEKDLNSIGDHDKLVKDSQKTANKKSVLNSF